ncbi:hypothetical protein [Streptomyces sp. NPDC046685]|uniref:hypothetical protein n=1 Tax=Streptomyces sp. NPDC046685 TaxID=3157202 RepID=UPI0033C8A0A5
MSANFLAVAAYETTLCMTSSPDHDTIDRLRGHLLALVPYADPAMHLAIVDAEADLATAQDAIDAYRALPRGLDRIYAQTHADQLLAAAVKDARAAITTIDPHAAQLRGTDMPITPTAIRAAAHAYLQLNGSAEEHTAIDTGTPMVDVHCRADAGLGRRITARITAGVRADIGFVPAHPPFLLTFDRLDGRLSPADNARRLLTRKDPSQAYLRVTDVPVEFNDGRRHR